MKIADLKVALQYAKDDEEVMIGISLPYSTVGARPMVAVKNAASGFDWESGRFIMNPVEEITPADRDFEKQFKDMEKKAGWLEYENRALKAQNKKLRATFGVD